MARRLIEAPSNLGLSPPAPGREPGVRAMPAALRARELRARLGAGDGGVVVAPAYDPERDATSGVRNGPSIAVYARALADRVDEALAAGPLPLVVGGDCSILLGPALALRRRGRFGLAFVDGHPDFRHPGGPDSTGAAAGEDLAIVTGRGGPLLTDLGGLRPYLRDEDVAAIGFDPADNGYAGLDRTAIARFDADAVRRRGAASVAAEALVRVAAPPRAGFWLHLDCDVLHDRAMPAVDSPNPAGMDLTIFDPTLDPTGDLAEALVALVAEAFRAAGRIG